jgi:hypothetical protein
MSFRSRLKRTRPGLDISEVWGREAKLRGLLSADTQ